MHSDESKGTPLKILVIDDSPENLEIMELMLAEVVAEIFCANSGKEGLELTKEHSFALILLDVMMPEMDGYETAKLLRQSEDTAGVPIIFVTAQHKTTESLFKGYQSGAVDYLFKPISRQILVAKTNVFLDLASRQAKLLKANTYIEEQRQQLQMMARTDGLTGLFNHAHFQESYGREFKLAVRHETALTVVLCDLDYFKDVNDTYGHQIGDIVLQQFAELLRSSTRSTDLLARYGGEEFILALPMTTLNSGMTVAEKIREATEKHIFQHEKIQLQTTVSIGVSTLGPENNHSKELIERADTALYMAKAGGRNKVMNYTSQNESEVEEADELRIDQLRRSLRTTLEKNKATVLASFEALVHKRFKGHLKLKERDEEALRLTNLIAKRMNLPRDAMQAYRRAIKFHNLYRLYVDDPLLKNGSELSPEEYQFISQQPRQMKEMMDMFDFFADERQILLYHHENYDGSGYPEGLEADEIPFGSRLFALIDSIVSITHPSSDTTPRPQPELIAELRDKAGQEFDPLLVEIMVSILAEE